MDRRRGAVSRTVRGKKTANASTAAEVATTGQAVQASFRQALQRWFAERGVAPFNFQREVWSAFEGGASGLVHASTGAGKTYAVWFGALMHALAKRTDPALADSAEGGRPLIVWVTPMRALAADTVRALQEPLAHLRFEAPGALAWPWQVGLRTGDTPAAERRRQDRSMPAALVTTPESLSLMLTRPDSAQLFSRLCVVVVDEWHELLGNKRGVQVQLALARLRRFSPKLLVWGLSATLADSQMALLALVGREAFTGAQLVRADQAKRLQIDTLLPASMERFPWGGHLGMRMLGAVIEQIEASGSTLIFTNTRSQAELWYQALLNARPDWAGLIALHHGSLDKSVRSWVESALKEDRLRAVVCTSSLDLGVDFAPVERVLQIGSPKGVARLIQRAGRSGHAPGRASRVTIVPTHALELLESAAAQRAVARQELEPRSSPRAPVDVLLQHLVTVALGTGFDRQALLAEVRQCPAYENLSQAAFDWAMDFVTRGGASLTAYPEYGACRPMNRASIAYRTRVLPAGIGCRWVRSWPTRP
jgi:ATP-dependent helicase Lhr and Lhr-like helicase